MSDSNHFEYINKLVINAKIGCQNSKEELILFYQPLIKSCVRKCIYNDSRYVAHKDDINSMAVFEFLKLIEEYDVTRSFFSYYLSNKLYTNLLKNCKDTFNFKSDITHEILFSEMPKLWDAETVDLFGSVEINIILSKALELLDPKYRICIELVYFQHLNQNEASEKLLITQSALSKRLDKALKELKNILEKKFGILEYYL